MMTHVVDCDHSDHARGRRGQRRARVRLLIDHGPDRAVVPEQPRPESRARSDRGGAQCPRALGESRGAAARFTQSTWALSATSIGTSAGFRTRLLRNNSAIGTVIDEKPYPSAPLTTAAASVIRMIAID